MELLRYVRSIKVVLILTMILLSPIKGLADGRKDEKIDRIEELSKKRSSSELDSVIEYIENLDMSKKKEVNKTQSRDTVVKRGNSNNSDNSKKIGRSTSTESRNNSQSWKLLGYIAPVLLVLSAILVGICAFMIKQLSRLKDKLQELQERINPQSQAGASEAQSRGGASSGTNSLSAKDPQKRDDLRRKVEDFETEIRKLKEENSSLREENSSLKKEIEKLKSQLQAETAVESPQETKSPSSEANQDKVEAPETRVYYIEKIPRNTNDIELVTEQTDKSYFKVTVQGTSTSATLSVVEDKSIAESGFVFIEEGYGGTGAKLISEGKGTIEYTDGAPKFTLTDKIKYKKV